MTASSGGGGGSGGGVSSPAPRAMKRELAFALQSLSEITASPGRTRSGRSLSSPAPSAPPFGTASKRRKTRSDPPIKDEEAPADLVSPPTPPLDSEAPKAATHDATDPPPLDAADRPPSVAEPQPKDSHHAAEPQPKANHHDDPVTVDVEPPHDADLMDACSYALPAGEKKDEKVDGSISAITPQHLKDGLDAPVEDADSTIELPSEHAEQDAGADEPDAAAAAPLAMPDAEEPAGLELDARPALQEPAAVTEENHRDKLMDACHGSDGPSIPDNVLVAGPPLAAEEATTPASTAGLKPARRFTRSLLGNKTDKEAATSESQGAEDKKEPSTDLAPTPGRRFTRSLLKPKVEEHPTSSLVVSEEPADSTSQSHTPPSVKKMEMKMSKKVDCLTKHPTNVRDLLSTGLLEGMPVMYIIPHSKKTVLNGVITGYNIRCFCVKCNGSKAISTYLFEQHAGSSKKHPADHIYLANGNSLRDVIRASGSSPLESLDKTIRSSIDPMGIRCRTNCLNCNGHLPSSQAEHFLCDCCLESKQDPTSPYVCSKSNSSMTPSSKDSLLKRMSSSKGGSTGKVTTKDTGLHKLVFKVLLDGTEVAYYVDGQRKVDGYIKDQRIYCNHCNRVVSPSAFEAHAGEGSRRKPYDNIFTSNGVSLHELSMKISKDMELSERETDDLCRECGLGGDIFACKMCPRSFHLACVGLSEVPSEWFCDNCSILVQKEKALAANKNAKAAGRQAGVDSIEQIMKRAIRIVPISDDLGGCALCKKKDFNNAVFDERTVILCDQCEKEYHVGCLRSELQVDLKELPEGEWFCCNSCSEIRSSLDKIISNGAQPLSESDIDIIRKKHVSRGLMMDVNTDIRWQLVAGRSATEDGNSLLSSAVPIIHQSFDPIVEAHTGRDLIPEMVNGRRPKDGMPGQDYSGMYCAVLTLGPTVVSAALLRVMGGDVAELPLVATSMDLQGLGYFQVLYSCLERMLTSLKIKHFMLPAAHEAESIWMNKFGFTRIPQEQLEAYLNGAHLTVFHGTANLYKAIPLS
uniref:Uncharacterized protein n=1 Tax=Avena sativa TaxID=4498 RepID=A0ACD5XXA6_AVESA